MTADALGHWLWTAPPWTPVRARDLLYLRTGTDEALVVACDSDGGLGPKPQDTVAVGGHELGRLATRVPLMEVMAVGATPVVVVDALGVEMNPTGATIIDGVLAELALIGLGPEDLTGSTEDNVATVATGVGVTVLGRVTASALRVGRSGPGDRLLLVGRPKSAPQHHLTADDPEIVAPDVLAAVLGVPHVVEALPVGSRGPDAEVADLADAAGLAAQIDRWPVPPDASGGPSSALVVTCRGPVDDVVTAAVGRPVWTLGHLR